MTDRRCQASRYSADSSEPDNVSWWLKSGGLWGAHSVDPSGKIDEDGSSVSYTYGVHPAIRIELGT